MRPIPNIKLQLVPVMNKFGSGRSKRMPAQKTGGLYKTQNRKGSMVL